MIHLSNVSKQYGNRTLFKDCNFQINANEKIGLVGPNGAGKTTIFRLITGEERPDTGNISMAEKTIVGYFSQDVGELRGPSVLEFVMKGSGRLADLAQQLTDFEKKFQDMAETPVS
ncbi:MAG: ATP-binding cassette domain-containing protein, partial [Pseudomonadota bacterium]